MVKQSRNAQMQIYLMVLMLLTLHQKCHSMTSPFFTRLIIYVVCSQIGPVIYAILCHFRFFMSLVVV
jgi:hypothetical protein